MNKNNGENKNQAISVAHLLKREHKPEILEDKDGKPIVIVDLDDKTATKVEKALENL